MDKPVGQLLSQWQSYLTNISTNLMELSEQTEYQIIKLKAKDAVNGYTGITKVKAEQCVEAVGALWRYFALLTEVFEKASCLYSKNSFLNSTEDDARELLEVTSIVIENERIAINERNLINGENKEKKATPRELLKYMQESFESACRTVAEISRAAEAVDSRLNNIKKDIEKLNSKAKHLGMGAIPSFNIKNVKEIESNPIQGLIELDKLVYSIEKYRASIKSVEGDYNNIIDVFVRVRETICELKDLASRSKEVIAKSQAIFGTKQTKMPVIGEDILKSLQDWLQVLERKLSEGQLNAVKIGASRLEEECSIKLSKERENYLQNSKDYNDYLDLKGQFKALCVKAEALKAKGLLSENSLNEPIINIKAALCADTVDLDKCKQLIRKFEFNLKK